MMAQLAKLPRRARAALIALALTSCASTKIEWFKAGATEQEWHRDSFECLRDSRTFGGGTGLVGAIMIEQAKDQAQKLYDSCMKGRGWEPREVKN